MQLTKLEITTILKYHGLDNIDMEPASEVVKRELLSWPGVTVHDHRFGGVEFRVNGREMGHMHGDELADLPFPKDVGRKLIAKKKASLHHFIPQSGWISYYIDGQGVPGVIELFRMQYERMTGYGKKAASIGALSGQTG